MNTLTFPLSVALETPTRRAVSVDPYASEAQTDALLRSGAAYRRERMQAALKSGSAAARAMICSSSTLEISAFIPTSLGNDSGGFHH